MDRLIGAFSPYTYKEVVLGEIISLSLFSSLLSVLKYAADPNDALPSITYFLMGSLSYANSGFLKILAIPMLIGVLILLTQSKILNALSLGEEEALSLGIDTKKSKFIIIIVATFVSSLSVCIAGVIGWIGLIVPHMCRFLCGADNKAVMSASAVVGVLFLLCCDTFSKMLLIYEIPIGIVTSLFGISAFIVMLKSSKKAEFSDKG